MLHEHKQNAPAQVSCAVLTVSDTRNKETDKSGKLIKELLEQAGHHILHYEIVADERVAIQQAVRQAIGMQKVEAVILNGGTGIARRDVTIESIQPFLDKELPGFGELFRMLSYQLDIGSAAILSRAVAGVANDRILFATPGSSGAVKLAMEKLILPELAHIVREIQKDLTS